MNRSYESYTTGRIEKKFRNLENRIMQDVARRIQKTKTITSSADYQLNRYYILGNSTQDIENIIRSAVGDDFPETWELYDEVIEKQYTRSKYLYEQVNQKFIPYEENSELQQIVDTLIRQSNEELFNITKSMGFMVDMGGKKVFTPLSDYYNEYLDNAMVEITSGAFDYNSVIRRVVGQMTNSGLRTVEYASGRTARCDVAARRAIMTGLSQLSGRISDTNAQRLGTEYFEIDWHSGARPEHRAWQGKVWSREQLTTVCGYGTVTGLLGANCYHEYYPFLPGISERNYTDSWLEEQNRKEDIPKTFKGREYTLYEATQRQRYLETNMRAQRQKVQFLKEAGADAEEITLARCKYQAQLDEYKAFSKKMGLPEQRERIYYDLQGRVTPSRPAIVRNFKKSIVKPMEKNDKMDYTVKRTKSQFEDVANEVRQELKDYSNNPSKWSGKIHVHQSLIDGNAIGVKEWSCNISVIDTADNGVVWHEMLHSCSASYFAQEVYAANGAIEEATVEFLKQQICKEKGISSQEGYSNLVMVLQVINAKFQYGTDLEFAKEIFNVPLPERYQWLENKVDDSLRSANASFEDYNDVILFLSSLKGAIA